MEKFWMDAALAWGRFQDSKCQSSLINALAHSNFSSSKIPFNLLLQSNLSLVNPNEPVSNIRFFLNHLKSASFLDDFTYSISVQLLINLGYNLLISDIQRCTSEALSLLEYHSNWVFKSSSLSFNIFSFIKSSFPHSDSIISFLLLFSLSLLISNLIDEAEEILNILEEQDDYFVNRLRCIYKNIFPKNESDSFLRGYYYSSNSDLINAIKYYHLAANDRFNQIYANNNIAIIYVKQNNSDKAIALLKSSFESDTNPILSFSNIHSLYNYCILLHSSQPYLVKSLLSKILNFLEISLPKASKYMIANIHNSLFISSNMVIYWLARCSMLLNEWNDAIGLFKSLFSSKNETKGIPSNLILYRQYIYSLIRGEKYSDAVEIANMALSRWNNDVVIHTYLADVYFARGHANLSIAEIDKALKLLSLYEQYHHFNDMINNQLNDRFTNDLLRARLYNNKGIACICVGLSSESIFAFKLATSYRINSGILLFNYCLSEWKSKGPKRIEGLIRWMQYRGYPIDKDYEEYSKRIASMRKPLRNIMAKAAPLNPNIDLSTIKELLISFPFFIFTFPSKRKDDLFISQQFFLLDYIVMSEWAVLVSDKVFVEKVKDLCKSL